MVRVRQAQDVVVLDELLDLLYRGLRVLHEVFRLAVLLADSGDDAADGLAPPLLVVGRQRLAGKALAPHLPGHDVQFALDPREFLLRLGPDLLGVQSRIQFQLQLAIETLFAEAPVPLGPGKQVLLEEILIVLKCRDDRLAGRRSSLRPGVSPVSSNRPLS